MKKLLLSIVLLLFTFNAYSTQLSGLIQIGPAAPVFKNLDTAIKVLNQIGISDDVTFSIDFSTTINNKFEIRTFSNPNNKSVRFVSSSGNVNQKAQITFNPNFTDTNYIFKINGASNLVFENLKFDNTSSLFKGIILLNENSGKRPNNIQFINCEFNASGGGTGFSHVLVRSLCSVNDLLFQDNKFNGGFQCINLGLFIPVNRFVTLLKNNFFAYDDAAVNITNIHGLLVQENNFNTANNNSTALGLNVVGGDSSIVITRNQFFDKELRLQMCNNNSVEKWISIDNNFITCSYMTPLHLEAITGNADVHIINNSITSSSGYVIAFKNAINNLYFKNNLCLQYQSVQKVFYLHDPLPAGVTHFNNNAYLYQGQFAEVATIAKTFTEWQTEYVLDLESIDDKMVSWDIQWGSFVENPNCKFPSRYKITQFIDSKYEFDLKNRRRTLYPSWVGCALVGSDNHNLGKISGLVKSGATIINKGKVALYADISNNAMFDIVSISNIDNDGTFTFNNLTAKEYAIKVMPDKTDFPNRLPTYYGGKFNWQTVYPMNADTCGSSEGIEIQVDSLIPQTTGGGTISGYITYDIFTNKTSDPIPGIDVVLDKIPPSKSVHIYTTGSDGYYEFNNLEDGVYQVKIDFVGINNDSLFMVEIDNNKNTYQSMDYCVDTNKITKVCGSALHVNKIKNNSSKISYYPNPFQNEIAIFLPSGENNIYIYDVTGKEVLRKLNVNSSYTMNTISLEEGIYFLSVNNSNYTETQIIVKH